MSIRSFALIAGLLVAGGALAQEAIPTAAGAPGNGAPPPSSSNKPLTIEDSRDRYDDGGPRAIGPCGAPAHEDGSPDRRVHGEVFAGVGTHGYREGGGVACIPIGDKAAATLAIDVGQYGRRR